MKFLWFALTAFALIVWFAYASRRRENGSTQAETNDRNPIAGDDENTIRVTLDVDAIQASVKDFHARRLHWSGKDTGAISIKSLTDNQVSCLHDAVLHMRIVPGDKYSPKGDTPPDVAVHPQRTVDSLVKHGFLSPNGQGAYLCTDHGARAFEVLPRRY